MKSQLTQFIITSRFSWFEIWQIGLILNIIENKDFCIHNSVNKVKVFKRFDNTLKLLVADNDCHIWVNVLELVSCWLKYLSYQIVKIHYNFFYIRKFVLPYLTFKENKFSFRPNSDSCGVFHLQQKESQWAKPSSNI